MNSESPVHFYLPVRDFVRFDNNAQRDQVPPERSPRNKLLQDYPFGVDSPIGEVS